MRHRLGPLMLALSLGWLSVAAAGQGAAWLLLWPSAAFAAAGAGYLGLGARVFGKRPDGSRSWPHALLTAPYLGAAWVAWAAIRLGPEPVFDRITPWLYLGRRPARGELPHDATAVVDLTAEFAIDRAAVGQRAYLCLPTLDAHVPDPHALAELVQRALDLGGVLYVHCAYGHGRSALVSAALLLRRGEASSPDEAVALLRANRPRVKLSPSQMEALRSLA